MDLPMPFPQLATPSICSVSSASCEPITRTWRRKDLDGWCNEWEQKRRQEIQLKACEYFAHLALTFLVTKEDYDIRSLQNRRTLRAVAGFRENPRTP